MRSTLPPFKGQPAGFGGSSLPAESKPSGFWPKNLAAPPEGDTARSVVAGARPAEMRRLNDQRRRREPIRPAAPSSAAAPGAGTSVKVTEMPPETDEKSSSVNQDSE